MVRQSITTWTKKLKHKRTPKLAFMIKTKDVVPNAKRSATLILRKRGIRKITKKTLGKYSR